MKQQILGLLKNAGGDPISGASIARELGVSRTAVWKAVEALRKDGYLIDAVTNRGYLLENASTVIDSQSITEHLATSELGRNMILLKEVDSTNNYAKDCAKSGARDGTLILTERQNAGRGRQGRSFYSPMRGGIYMSMILRPDMSAEQTSIVTILAAAAVCETLNEMYAVGAKIKWVNDIYIGTKKICGILTEAGFEVETGKLEYAVLGIGINLYHSEFPDELKTVITSLEDHTDKEIDINEMIAHVWNRFERYYHLNDYTEAMLVYRKNSMVLGCVVQYERNGELREALAESIDDSGSLIVKNQDGSREVLRSGEVRIRLSE